MNLYIWTNLPCLKSYTNGVAFSLAKSRLEAQELIEEEIFSKSQKSEDFYWDEEQLTVLRNELNIYHPSTHSESMAFAMMGGE